MWLLIGKIAGDVSKCASSDIKIWNSFVDSCENKLESCDQKDILRIVRAIINFYRFYGHEIRTRDHPFVEAVLEQVVKYCEAYNCGELGEISEIFSDLANHNPFVLQGVFTLLSKISITFKLRLAEAIPIDVIKLSLAFSKLGIRDDPLFGTLVNFACNGSNGFRLEDHRILLTSYAIIGYYDEKLLEIVLDGYSKTKNLSSNDLGILSFIFSKLDYKNDRVKQLFYKHKIDSVELFDIPSFCANLYKLDITVPENLVKRIDVDKLSAELFFDTVPLLARSIFPDELIMTKYLEFIKDSTFDDHVKILEYIVNSEFTESMEKLCNMCIKHIFEGISRDNLHALPAEGETFANTSSIDNFQTLQLLIKLPCCWLYDYIEKFGTIFKSVPIKYKSQFITLLFGLYTFFDFAPGSSLIPEIEKHFGTSIQEALSEIIAQENVNRAPYTLCAEVEELLGDKTEVSIL
ncbi:hypothetical protein BEWA_036130 [Theileria equi strain WA]|uniref:Uncharacterized protein n=1 Tax=Theileria equi strain WA TaxID=1537102 RepID=L1LDP9_THEEQ|nr:hypothetical protein BEWA_036130 [Theileria equi strain WA]EKX73577.1 hypothetical protein BEWA_036130 [Theileria equi strain WA]|eukprot:XP_004833029.1 hypothetical protein BEWA_036130 [Theileria equi strain WA]